MEQKTVSNQNAGYGNVTATCQQELYETKTESSCNAHNILKSFGLFYKAGMCF